LPYRKFYTKKQKKQTEVPVREYFNHYLLFFAEKIYWGKILILQILCMSPMNLFGIIFWRFTMKHKTTEINISEILQNQEKVVAAIQAGIKLALLKHKQAGNPVCTWQDGKVVWISPDKIPVDDNTTQY